MTHSAHFGAFQNFVMHWFQKRKSSKNPNSGESSDSSKNNPNSDQNPGSAVFTFSSIDKNISSAKNTEQLTKSHNLLPSKGTVNIQNRNVFAKITTGCFI